MNQAPPTLYQKIKEATTASGFDMASDELTCSLLRTLAGAKPSGDFLELGTGTGLAAAWILDGMDQASTLTSVDNNDQFLAIAKKFLNEDSRLNLVLADAEDWMKKNKQKQYDYIFADTWHGKYLLLDEALLMLKKGGFYIIDDLLPQSNWPEGHQEKAMKLMNDLTSRRDLQLTRQVWATGIIIAVKK